MLSFLQRFRLWLLPPVSRKKALCIAVQRCEKNGDQCHLWPKDLAQPMVYKPEEPYWTIWAPQADRLEEFTLRCSRVIMVSKLTGEVLWDGTANDEG